MRYIFVIIYFVFYISAHNVFANKRFISNVPCIDVDKYCMSSGERIIEGIKIKKDCWEWAYIKKCDYPSKNDCAKYGHCYALGQYDCLLRDSIGNCVNVLMEFSCKRKVHSFNKTEIIRNDLEEKEGLEGIVCKTVPCMDGNCFDKSYVMDEDMARSISYLGALSQGKNINAQFKIFEGQARKCSKKPVGYLNCCAIGEGWGENFGAKCSNDENILKQQREKKLCQYIGKTTEKVLGVVSLVKHHFCCFNNILEKTVQVDGRKQLGISFGSGNGPDCRGLTLEELERIDWSKIDFSEFANEIKKKLVMPNSSDLQERVKSTYKENTRAFDHSKPSNEDNKKAGINKTISEDE